MPDLDWDVVKGFFTTYDLGDLPEGFVPGCSLDDWQAVFDLLRSSGWQYDCLSEPGHDFVAVPLPTPRDVMRWHRSNRGLLRVWPDPVLQVHFWLHEETQVDFDVTLAELVAEGRRGFDVLCEFLGVLGRLLGKPVLLCEEGETDPFLRFDVTADRVVCGK